MLVTEGTSSFPPMAAYGLCFPSVKFIVCYVSPVLQRFFIFYLGFIYLFLLPILAVYGLTSCTFTGRWVA